VCCCSGKRKQHRRVEVGCQAGRSFSAHYYTWQTECFDSMAACCEAPAAWLGGAVRALRFQVIPRHKAIGQQLFWAWRCIVSTVVVQPPMCCMHAGCTRRVALPGKGTLPLRLAPRQAATVETAATSTSALCDIVGATRESRRRGGACARGRRKTTCASAWPFTLLPPCSRQVLLEGRGVGF
jgi:hypothetical protein